MAREQGAAEAGEVGAWLERVLDSCEVLAVDAAAFREWARLMHRQADKLLQDALIAAVAIVHRLTVAARSTRGFDHLNVPALNFFAWSAAT
ncbi:MAG: PIN domain-containing protein [bacterium]|nr:PIN domain-containing protein [bacterium]